MVCVSEATEQDILHSDELDSDFMKCIPDGGERERGQSRGFTSDANR